MGWRQKTAVLATQIKSATLGKRFPAPTLPGKAAEVRFHFLSQLKLLRSYNLLALVKVKKPPIFLHL